MSETLEKYMEKLKQLREAKDGSTEEDVLGELDIIWNELADKAVSKQFSLHRIYIKVVAQVCPEENRTPIGDDVYFVYDVDPFSELAPQLSSCVEDAKERDLSEMIKGVESQVYLGLVER